MAGVLEGDAAPGGSFPDHQSGAQHEKSSDGIRPDHVLNKGGRSEPAQSTESISYLIYRNGMDGGQFGFQSANAVIFFLVIVGITVAQLTIMNKKEEQL